MYNAGWGGLDHSRRNRDQTHSNSDFVSCCILPAYSLKSAPWRTLLHHLSSYWCKYFSRISSLEAGSSQSLSSNYFNWCNRFRCKKRIPCRGCTRYILGMGRKASMRDSFSLLVWDRLYMECRPYTEGRVGIFGSIPRCRSLAPWRLSRITAKCGKWFSYGVSFLRALAYLECQFAIMKWYLSFKKDTIFFFFF